MCVPADWLFRAKRQHQHGAFTCVVLVGQATVVFTATLIQCTGQCAISHKDRPDRPDRQLYNHILTETLTYTLHFSLHVGLLDNVSVSIMHKPRQGIHRSFVVAQYDLGMHTSFSCFLPLYFAMFTLLL